MSTKIIDTDTHPETRELTDDTRDTASATEDASAATPEESNDDTAETDTNEGTSTAQRSTKGWTPVGTRVLRGRRALVVSAVAVVVVALAIATGIFAYLYHDKSNQFDAVQSSAADTAHAEKIALDYATGAAQMGYQDLDAWNKRLTAGTSPELASKLTNASTAMQQVIVPLQWNSTASPIAAQLKSHDGNTYVVTAFVSVMTKNAQAPHGVQSTASYTVTMDSSKNWLITDVGGLDGAVAPK
ncbi:hypothetical protein [Gordonia oryzae]|uniref:hypothetical protein n=1 Tax=Gordonia oryzae TaxID=2487349 RepID=UPI001FE4CF36|nr:hypothetical protein [Gordonia oryzae]